MPVLTREELQNDLIGSWILLAIITLGIIAYGVRVLRRGEELHFDRVNQQGGSALLSLRVMEMAYWNFGFIGRFFFRLNIAPTTISFASLLFAALSGWVAAYGFFGSAGFLFAVSGAMDAIDGMVARMHGVRPAGGAVVDSSVDRYSDFFLPAGVAIYYHHSVPILIICLAAIMGSFMISYSTAKAEILKITPPRGTMKRTERVVYLIGGAILTPMAALLVNSSPFSWLPVQGMLMVLATLLIAVMANGSAIHRITAIIRTANQRQADKSNAPS
ncbi:MAG: CDP-alcohol phosphatidyltransferase family protein [Magnetococcales bacterium]|nr:CDP-alcohol phosphatidyltransferase family protein [Magnetococcales bacterium]